MNGACSTCRTSLPEENLSGFRVRKIRGPSDTVRKWRSRYAKQRLAGLADARRPGRPRRFSAVQRAQVTAIACELPATRGMPLSRWSSFELACEAIEAGVVVDISASTVARWLAADAIKPWQRRSWSAPRAPDFASKATVVLDLYARVWDGQPLGPDDYVLCSDEDRKSTRLN